MIFYLNGTYALHGKDFVIIDVQGVGYRVFVSSATLARLPQEGESVKIYTYQHVKEDALTLYGFLTRREEELFTILLSVSGVGPKLALAILAALPPGVLEKVVITGDITALTQISGVGKKTAQRLLLELKDKVGHIDMAEIEISDVEPVFSDTTAEVTGALIALGYSALEAEKAVKQIGEVESVEEGIRKALKQAAGSR